MFCEKCGAPISEGDKFCGECGALNEEIKNEETVEQPVDENVEQPVEQTANYYANDNVSQPESSLGEVMENGETITEEMLAAKPAKKGFFTRFTKKTLIRTGIIAGILAVLVAFGVWAAPYVSNAFAKMTMSPEKYFQHVTTNWFKSNMKDIGNAFGEAKDVFKKDISSEGTAKFVIGAGLKDLISDNTPSQVSDVLEQLDSISIDAKVNKTKDAFAEEIALKANDSEIVTANIIFDMKSENMYFSVPELSDTALCANIGGAMSFGEVMTYIDEIVDLIPDKDKFAKFMTGYFEAAIKKVDKVDEKEGKLEVGGVKQNATVLKATIDAETLLNMGKGALEYAKEDKETEKLIKDFLNTELASEMDAPDADEVYDAFKDGVDTLIEEMEDVDVSDESIEVYITVYVNAKGEIIALKVNANEDLPAFEVFIGTAEKGSKIATEIYVDVDGQKVSIEGEGKLSGSKLTGKYNLKVFGTDIITVSVEKFDLDSAKKGMTNGKITIKAADSVKSLLSVGANFNSELKQLKPVLDVISEMKIEVDSKESKNKSEGTLSIYYKDDLYLTVEAAGKIKSGAKITIPKDSTDDPSDWDVDPDVFIDKIRDAGLSELADLMESQM